MAVKFGIGDVSVSPVEYQDKLLDGSIADFFLGMENNRRVSLAFEGGVVTPKGFNASERSLNRVLRKPVKGKKAEAFAPVGIGKPLCVRIHTIYTGNMPSNLFGSKTGMLVSSAVKVKIGSVDVSPRAINLLCERINDFQSLQLPSAVMPGTPIAYYSPSVVDEVISIHFEFIADKFAKPVVNQVVGLLTSASTIPIFAPAASYLMVGSTVINIAQQLAEALAPNKVFMQEDVVIQMTGQAGGLLPEFKPRNMYLCNDKDVGAFADYAVGAVDHGTGNYQLALVHRNSGSEYKGPAPYMIATFDGKRDSGLDDFAPTLVSAALLDQFYGGKPGEQAVSAVKSAMQLYNDAAYNLEAEKLKKEMQKHKKTSKEYLELKARVEAYNSGIKEQRFVVKI
jgi:hypothetical protein